MSKGKLKPRTAYYKQAIITGDKKLSVLLKSALIGESCTFNLPETRHYKPNRNSDDFYVLNEVSMQNEMLYGELVYIEKDKYQTILKLEPGASIYKQTTVTVDDVDLKDIEDENITSYQKEFVENTLYFGVFENHVVVIQTTSLKINRLRDYLDWLLSSEKNDLLDGSIILFKDKPSIEARKKLASEPAKQVRISQQVLAKPITNSNTQGFKSASFTFDAARSGIWQSIVESLNLEKQLGSKLANTLEEDNIYIDVVLRRKRSKGNISDAGQSLVDTVATSFVNLSDEDFEITYKGGTLTGKDFRLHETIKVQTFKDGVNHLKLKKDFYDFLMRHITDS